MRLKEQLLEWLEQNRFTYSPRLAGRNGEFTTRWSPILDTERAILCDQWGGPIDPDDWAKDLAERLEFAGLEAVPAGPDVNPPGD